MTGKSDMRALEAYNVLKAYCREQNGLCSSCLFADTIYDCIFEYETYPCEWQTIDVEK